MGFFSRIFRRQVDKPASPPAPLETLNLADCMRVLLVEKVKAETELASVQLEERRKDLEWKSDRRQRQREAGRNRVRNARRSANGQLLPNERASTCFLCLNPGKPGFSLQQLEDHRAHRSAINGAATATNHSNVH
jgi:hypothetical protein